MGPCGRMNAISLAAALRSVILPNIFHIYGRVSNKNPGATMRLIVLTTGAVRRRYFVGQLQRRYPIARIFVETRDPKPPFPVAHPLDAARKAAERDAWFDGAPPAFESIAEVERHDSLNAPAAIASMRALRPDVAIVYGTGRLSADVIATCPQGCVNFHNGDPEEYRGLDCHLWPVYHRDFAALRMTLHRIEPELDTGAIVDRRPVPLVPAMPLSELRRAATELATAMALDALAGFARDGVFAARPQVRTGRYYSWMPAVLKDICVRNFERHTNAL